jgi:hypothetical protein
VAEAVLVIVRVGVEVSDAVGVTVALGVEVTPGMSVKVRVGVNTRRVAVWVSVAVLV